MTRKEIKTRARQTVKKHYMMLVMVSLIAVFLGLQSSSFDNFVRMYSSESVGTDTEGMTDTRVAVGNTGLVDVLNQTMSGDTEEGRQLSEALKKEEIERSGEENRILGRSRGALSKIVNGITSGSLFVMFVSGINSLSGSKNLGSLILIMLAFAGVLGFNFLIVNTYTVISARMFLEGRIYDKLPAQRFVFLLRVKRWMKVSLAMLKYTIYQALWMLTVIGGVIKYYSYSQVPYILAENPDLTGREAITLSRRMMRGHKWELFLLDCSFIGWSILGACTFGLSEVFYSLPYQSASFCEYYVRLRGKAKESGILGAELLNDRYLYERAADDVLWEAYMDVLEWEEDTELQEERPGRIRRVLADWFGILLGSSQEERAYEERREREVRLGMLKDAAEGRMYPGRLSRFPEAAKQKRVETFHYMRRYSVWSLVLLFFIFSFIGWCWEVSLHLVLDGVFVNRGALHGPWLPIYGSGGVLLLTLLNRVRSSPVKEFFCIIFVCGMVEYWTSYYLEMVYDGMKWWDYSGYFLNLNGRICAEGLLVFGIGGMVFVYIAAPLLDNRIRVIRKQVLVWSCLILLGMYAADTVYSAGHPNEGEGITDYEVQSRFPDLHESAVWEDQQGHYGTQEGYICWQ
ncbi:MAG: DUF975 family protein [Dorea sp.]|jgi:hypothetical protein|nr:DUF975 family protein [Dorea sp.]